MVFFFFYHHLMHTDNLNKLHEQYTMEQGYVMVQSYDEDTHRLCLCKKKGDPTKLYGRMVEFKQITLQEIITKLNDIEEIRLGHTNLYTLDTIQAYTLEEHSQTCYIIYNELCINGVPTTPLRL